MSGRWKEKNRNEGIFFVSQTPENVWAEMQPIANCQNWNAESTFVFVRKKQVGSNIFFCFSFVLCRIFATMPYTVSFSIILARITQCYSLVNHIYMVIDIVELRYSCLWPFPPPEQLWYTTVTNYRPRTFWTLDACVSQLRRVTFEKCFSSIKHLGEKVGGIGSDVWSIVELWKLLVAIEFQIILFVFQTDRFP